MHVLRVGGAENFGIQFWALFAFRRRCAPPKFLASNFGHSFLARFLNILRFRTKPNFLSETLGAQFLSSEILKAHFLNKTVSYMREPTVGHLATHLKRKFDFNGLLLHSYLFL